MYKRLIEVDLPIKTISAHARREKSIRHGHISTLHIWWARRPLAACRAVILGALWPDPADPECPPAFRDAVAPHLAEFAEKVATSDDLTQTLGPAAAKWIKADNLRQKGKSAWETPEQQRQGLLDFIGDASAWELSNEPAMLNCARGLVKTAYPDQPPLVADPFAGGGSIPLEALRMGADAFASDLNPVAVLINKMLLEYIPKYGQQLAVEVQKWGAWIKEQAEKELADFYPKDSDGSRPIAYLWARTIRCEGPGCGAEVPLIRSLWLAKKGDNSVGLRLVSDQKRKYVEFEIIRKAKTKDVGEGTVRRGSATCPVCGYTTPVARVREQLQPRCSGAKDARLFCIVTTKATAQGRFYRLPTERDLDALRKAAEELDRRKKAYIGSLSLVPDEPLPPKGTLGFRVQLYGMKQWGDIFTPRQQLALSSLANLIRKAGDQLLQQHNLDFVTAVQTCLAFAVNTCADHNSSLCSWRVFTLDTSHVFGRQTLSMAWDIAETDSVGESTGSFQGAIGKITRVINQNAVWTISSNSSTSIRASATNHPLPNESAQVLFTDPPYYDAVPYADLSDFFYVWLKRTLPSSLNTLFTEDVTPKAEECIVDDVKKKDHGFFEKTMTQAMAEGRRLLRPEGIGIVVFAHKSTAGWEAQLQAMIESGWTITGSWPVDTEMGTRLRAYDSAALSSSIHLVCRPRESHIGSFSSSKIGDWRDVLARLPKRIHEWMPRLAQEGIVGADAIFACLGPALEIFSQYERVETAGGKVVSLSEYLEHVWAAVGREAFNQIFTDADPSGFEEDARLTAIWFWAMKPSNGTNHSEMAEVSEASEAEDEASSEDETEDTSESRSEKRKPAGYSMEYDTARKLAQGLGVDLQELSRPGGVVMIKGNLATLNSIAARERFLIGFQLGLFQDHEVVKSKGSKRNDPSAVLKGVGQRQPDLFDPLPEPTRDHNRPYLPGLEPPKDQRTLMQRLLDNGSTLLDRLHQTMLLFGRGQTALLRPFMVESGVAENANFWRLAQALSALYPASSQEKRWVDGVLSRKKGLGL
jgi:putative DNA methylase